MSAFSQFSATTLPFMEKKMCVCLSCNHCSGLAKYGFVPQMHNFHILYIQTFKDSRVKFGLFPGFL